MTRGHRADRCEANLRAAASQHDAQRAELKQRDEDLEKNLKVLDRLEEVDDVDTVEHNMAL